MKSGTKVALAVSALILVTSLGGCKAKEAPNSGFLSAPEKMSQKADTPFNRIYWNEKYDRAAYTQLLVAPVNINYVMAQNVWETTNLTSLTKDEVRKDIQALADYTREAVIRAASDDPHKRFQIVETAGPRTLILEMALVQVVPSKAVLNAIGYVTWVPAVVSAAGAAASDSQDTGKGVVAIEGRVRDGSTGEVIGMFADRESPKMALLDLKALNWWAPAKAIVDDWAKQLVAMANRKRGERVKDSAVFDLVIW